MVTHTWPIIQNRYKGGISNSHTSRLIHFSDSHRISTKIFSVIVTWQWLQQKRLRNEILTDWCACVQKNIMQRRERVWPVRRWKTWEGKVQTADIHTQTSSHSCRVCLLTPGTQQWMFPSLKMCTHSCSLSRILLSPCLCLSPYL